MVFLGVPSLCVVYNQNTVGENGHFQRLYALTDWFSTGLISGRLFDYHKMLDMSRQRQTFVTVALMLLLLQVTSQIPVEVQSGTSDHVTCKQITI